MCVCVCACVCECECLSLSLSLCVCVSLYLCVCVSMILVATTLLPYCNVFPSETAYERRKNIGWDLIAYPLVVDRS